MRSSRSALILALALFLLAVSAVPAPVRASSLLLLQGFPTLKQQRSLTCESSVASMATRAAVTESQIMSVIPHNPNPNLGFRGNPSGQQGQTLIDYGVYAAPLQRALTQFGYHSDLLLYSSRAQVESYIRRGWPVEVWATYRLQPGQPRLAAARGVQFFLVPHEHALLVVGYDAHTLYVNDPWTARQVRYRWSDFLRSWGLFQNMALAIDPCPLPGVVPSGRVTKLSAASVTWTWEAAPRAAHYAVTITKLGAHPRIVFTGTQDIRRVTLSSPDPGAQYRFDVWGVSPCGERGQPLTLVAQLPDVLPTPTPGPTLTITPVPERTLVVSPTSTTGPSVTATPTVTATPKR